MPVEIPVLAQLTFVFSMLAWKRSLQAMVPFFSSSSSLV